MAWRPKPVLSVAFSFALACNVGTSAETPEPSWADSLTRQILQHPELVSARERMDAAISIAESRARPFYNPEFETELERDGSDQNFLVGISQTVDWSDKRGIRTQQASIERLISKQAFQLVFQQKVAELLSVMVEWRAAKRRAELARQQEEQVGILLELAKERQRAGDLGLVDVELTIFSLAQELTSTAHAMAQFSRTDARLQELVPNWKSARDEIPERVWALPARAPENQWVSEHPAVVVARAASEVAKLEADLARRERKADPTFGFSTGKTGGEEVVAFTFAMPLNIRNRFNAEARAAEQEALAAEAAYHSISRSQQSAIDAAQRAMSDYQQRYIRWQKLTKGRGEHVQDLLERQWRSGDISTAEYLIGLQQRADGLNAGIEIQERFRLALIEWLSQTGQVTTFLANLEQ